MGAEAEAALRISLKDRKATTQGLKEISSGLADVGQAAEDGGKKADEAGNRWSNMVSGTKVELSNLVKYGSAAFSAIGAGAIVAGAMAEKQTSGMLSARLGLSPTQTAKLAKVASKVYADNWGESLGDVSDSVAVIKQNLTGLGRVNLAKVTTDALAFKDTFGYETEESIKAVAQMMRTGLAPSAKAAFDILTRGEQLGADKAGDLLDTFNEYGTQFRNLGINGKQALGLIQQGLQGGARDSDLVGDALKEFSIRAVDGSKTTAAGFAGIGLNAADMAEKIGKGGKGARRGLQDVLDGLRGIEDPAKRSHYAVDLFGTQAEDLGNALYHLNPKAAASAKSIGKVAGAATHMTDAAGSAASPIDSLKRSMQGAFLEVGADALPIMEPLFDLIGKSGPVVVALGAAYVAYGAASKIAAAGTAIFGAAEEGANAALMANPIGLVVGALVALGVGLVMAYKHSEKFRDIVDGAFHGVADAGKFMWDDVLRPTFKYVGDAFLDTASVIVHGADLAFGWIKPLSGKLDRAVEAVDSFRDKFNNALDGIHDKKVNVGVQVSGGAALRSLLDPKAPKAPSSVVTGGSEWSILGDGSIPKHRRRASGGPAVAGTEYVVGEHHAELFRPAVDGYLSPNMPTPAGAASTAGNQAGTSGSRSGGVHETHSFNIYIDGKQMKDVVIEHVKKEIARR